MITFSTLRKGLMAAAFVTALPAIAVTSVSMDELLKQVESGRVDDAKENAARIRAFKKDKAGQIKKLGQIKAERRREEARSQRLEDTFDANEIKIIALEKTLHDRLGTLKELFGVLQQAAGDARATFDASLTQPQFPERSEVMTALAKKMGQTTQLASMEDIERLWFEMQREMTETGKITKFKTKIIDADGNEVEKTVVRIGAFNVIADGKYLNYIPETGRLVELKRQPQSRYLGKVGTLENSTSGQSPFGLDPSRGQLLSLLVQSPTTRERVDQGGIVGYIIVGIGIFAFLVAIYRLIVLTLTSAAVSRQEKNIGTPGNNPLGRVLKAYHDNKDANMETLELRLGEAVLKETPKFNRNLPFMKIVAAVAPLMGLLGTVTGMIVTFQAITLYGAGDPKLMAGGISQALMTTVLGLVVAIPALGFLTLMAGKAKRLTQVLEEQAVGMVAEHSEQNPS